MDKQDKIFLWAVLITILITALWCTTNLIEAGNQYQKIKNQFGKSIIIYGDTSTIMEYNSKGSFYILSNGRIVPFDQIKLDSGSK
jgi:hypothetical protein